METPIGTHRVAVKGLSNNRANIPTNRMTLPINISFLLFIMSTIK